jgi:hypothetical protein
MPLDQGDLVSVQIIRDEWNATPLNDPLVESLKPFADGDNIYQLWLEVQLMYARRWQAELGYRLGKAYETVSALQKQSQTTPA